MAPLTELAAAKVNLTLQVLGRRPDGYHEIQSLTAFADLGDQLSLEPGDELRLDVVGENAGALTADNLVLKAAHSFIELRPEAKAGTFRLHKSLPVAAGLGGGSADAAAAVRLLMRANDIVLNADEATSLCLGIGADVRVCLDSRAAIMWGVGEKQIAIPPLPQVPAVLVNPAVPLSTPAVFKALSAANVTSAGVGEPNPVGPFEDVEELAAFAKPVANDLEAAAKRLEPTINKVQDELLGTSGVLLVRLSGSGPTVFGLFSQQQEAAAAAAQITSAHPDWWVRSTVLS